jgi:uncharacterized protein YraI
VISLCLPGPNVNRDLLRKAIAFGTVGLLLGGATGRGVMVDVTDDRVNLRAAPREKAEVVGQAMRGDVLSAPDGITGEWVKVSPPPQAAAWIYGDLVKDGVVRVSAAQVRAGPGINYTVIGRLRQGDTVRVTDSPAEGEWLRIDPPADSFVWISAQYVNLSGQSAHTTSGEASGTGVEPTEVEPTGAEPAGGVPPVSLAGANAPAAPPKPSAQPPQRKPPRPASVPRTPPSRQVAEPARQPAAGLPAPSEPAPVARSLDTPGPLVAGKPQGERVVVEGALAQYSALVWRRPSRFSIVGRDAQGRPYAVCFVQGDANRLRPLVGKRVRLTGRRYWVQGVRDPVVTADEIAAVVP